MRHKLCHRDNFSESTTHKLCCIMSFVTYDISYDSQGKISFNGKIDKIEAGCNCTSNLLPANQNPEKQLKACTFAKQSVCASKYVKVCWLINKSATFSDLSGISEGSGQFLLPITLLT